MRGLIVGFGFIAEAHLLGSRATSGLDLVAAVDVSPARREAAARAGLSAFATIDEALASVDVHFVDVCTPPTLHLSGIRAAVRRGLPVLCEKPVFVPGESDLDEVVALAASGRGLLYPCQNYKFAPIFTRVRQLLGAGAVGDLRVARIDIARAGHARGVPEWRPDWRREPEFSAGGILRDHGPHAVYLLLSMVLGQLPLEVAAVAGELVGARPAGRWELIEDSVMMRIRCPDVVECDVSLTWASAHRSSRYLFVGTRGFISIDNDRLTWSAADETRTESIRSDFDDPSHSAWFGDMLTDFQRIVQGGAANSDEAFQLVLESLRTTAVIEAAYESARCHGTWVPVPDAAPVSRGLASEEAADPTASGGAL